MHEAAKRVPVLVAHPGRLFPPQGGGSVRMLRLLRYLHTADFEVHLLTRTHSGAAAKALEEHVYKVWSARPLVAPTENRQAFRSLLRRTRRRLKRMGQPERVVENDLERRRDRIFEEWCFEVSYRVRPAAVLAPYAWNARILDRVPPEALGVLDTIDVQHVRTSRAREAGGDLESRRCTREQEQRELERADVLIAMQDEEAALLRAMCPESHVVSAGHACPVSAAPMQTSDTPTLLFAANLYDPNVRGIQQFLADVWPKLRARVPDAGLLVCGRICDALTDPPEGVRLLGFVADLEWLYKASAALINPVPYSTGLSVKVTEALARGRCVVASPPGVRGLDAYPDLPVEVADTPGAFVEILAPLLSDLETRKKRELKVWEWAKEHLAPERVYAPIAEVLRDHTRYVRD